MSRPKTDPKRTDAMQVHGGGFGGPAAGAEAATGAATASGGVPNTAGAETDSSAPADPDQSLVGVLTPAELCEQLGIDAADVLAINLDTGVIVTRDGQRHRLANV